MSDAHRDKIRNSNILNALVEHAEGSREMTGTQVTAALGLLKKVMPDLSAVDMHAEHDISDPLKELLGAVNGRTRGLPNSG